MEQFKYSGELDIEVDMGNESATAYNKPISNDKSTVETNTTDPVSSIFNDGLSFESVNANIEFSQVEMNEIANADKEVSIELEETAEY